jgi:hypothetical protein
MAQFSIYNPFLSKKKVQKSEPSKFQIEPIIPISFPVTEYKNADPDKEVIPIPGFTPTIAQDSSKKEEEISGSDLESARQTLTSRSENKSSNKVV